MIISRRKTLIGLFAAPAIIAYDRLMPVSAKLIVPEPYTIKILFQVDTKELTMCYLNGAGWI